MAAAGVIFLLFVTATQAMSMGGNAFRWQRRDVAGRIGACPVTATASPPLAAICPDRHGCPGRSTVGLVPVGGIGGTCGAVVAAALGGSGVLSVVGGDVTPEG